MIDADPSLLVLSAILAGAAFVSAVTGFGFALIATPFLVLILPPQIAVPIVLVSWYPLAVVLIWRCYRQMSPRRILRLLLFGVLGLPVGVYGLATLPAESMQLVIGCTTLAASATLVIRPGEPLRREGIALAGAGLLSGAVGGGSGMTGPPVVLLGLKQRWPHEGFRADLIGYFFCLHAVMTLVLGEIGLVGEQTWRLTLSGLPGVVVGAGVGLWLQPRVRAETYRRLSMALIVAGGVLATLFR